MKTTFLLFFMLFLSMSNTPAQNNTDNITGKVEITLSFEKQEGRGSNQYAVWIEDNQGNLVKTLFVTRFTAQGGWEKRPACNPVWVQRATAQPLPKEEVDGFTGATPSSGTQTYTWDGTDRNGIKLPNGIYKFVVEGTLYNDNYVMYEGEINTSKAEYIVMPRPEYRTEIDTHKDMIQNVSASFKP